MEDAGKLTASRIPVERMRAYYGASKKLCRTCGNLRPNSEGIGCCMAYSASVRWEPEHQGCFLHDFSYAGLIPQPKPVSELYQHRKPELQDDVTDYQMSFFSDEASKLHITVYLGANEGNTPVFRERIRELGGWIGANGHTLVYGGSKSGLMGVLADSVLEAGGEAIGVEPQFFIEQAVQHESLTELIVTKDMSERKAKMLELGDAFIAFPGGTGTLEEISEVMSAVSLKLIDAPCIIYNLDGYYDALKALLARMTEMGLSSEERQCGIHFASNLQEIAGLLENCGPRKRDGQQD